MLEQLAGAGRGLMALVAALAAALPATGSAAPATSRSTAVKPAASAARATPAGATLGGVVRGQATHYGPAGQGGNCSFPTIPANRYTVAAGPSLYAAGAACGGYLRISGPRGTIVAKIDNQCPECGPGHLDLSDEAFAAISPLAAGLVKITYRPVTNPRVSGGLTFVVKSGSSRYWLGLLVDNAGNRLRSVEVASGSGWRALTRTDYGYWLAQSGAGTGPFTVRVTDVAGHRVVAHGVRLAPGQAQATSVRLYS
jgi:expansin (peptidoglycan-binding protein)